MADDPPYLTVGTEVSAKYKGAFCEAKIRKVVRIVKCKVTFKGAGNGSALLPDDQIKGTLRLGAVVEAKHPDKNQYLEATINKIQDSSQYTVVFDDGDITTLRRSALCLKSGRHFNESETLDQLPLTHPEHFSNPVVGGRRGVRRRAADKDESSDEEEEDTPTKKDGRKKYEKELDMGKVVCVESTDKKKSKDTWFPALVVSPAAQETVKIRIKDEYLVRSFRDGRYYTVPKKEITEFTKESQSKYDSNSNVLRTAVEKALQYLDKNELPPHWDREVLFGNARQSESGEGEDQQSESEVSEDDPKNEEKDRFIAQLYKFMDDRSTPLNKVPQVCNKDLDLHKLFKVVTAKGGYTKVTNQGEWKAVTIKLGYGKIPTTSTITLVKQAYKKYLVSFEEFYRKLGCTWTPRSLSSTSKSRSSRSLYRDRATPSSSRESSKKGDEEDGRSTPSKKEKVASKEEKEDNKPPASSPEAESPGTAAGDTGSEESAAAAAEPKQKPPEVTAEEPRKSSRGRQPKKNRDDEETASPSARKKRQANASASRDRDSSVASSTKEEKESSAPPTPSSGTPTSTPAKKGVGRGKYKRHGSKLQMGEKDEESGKDEEKVPEVEKPPVTKAPGIEIRLGDKLKVYYPKSEGETYEAKVIDINEKAESFLVHYAGWNSRYDEWIDKARVKENLTLQMELTGEVDKTVSATTSGAAKGKDNMQGAKQRKGRNSSSTTSTTSTNSTTVTTTSTTPGGTRSGSVKSTSGSAAGATSSSPVSSKRRRSTSTDMVQAVPPPKRRRTRQKSGQEASGPPGPPQAGSDSEPETSDSDGRSIKSDKSPVKVLKETSPAIVPEKEKEEKDKDSKEPKSKKNKSSEDVKVGPGKSEKNKKDLLEIEDAEDEVSCGSAASTKSKDITAKVPVEDSKDSTTSSSGSSTAAQVIDLDQIRSEMKGLDKMVKSSGSEKTSSTPGSVSSPAPPTLSAAVGSSPAPEPKVDIYEFQEDGSDDQAPPPITATAPKLKMFSPVARSTTATGTVEKSPVVSSSSAEAVAKLMSQDQEKDKPVPIVAMEKIMEKEKAPASAATKASSITNETTPASKEPLPLKSTAKETKESAKAQVIPPPKSVLPPVIHPITTTVPAAIQPTTATPSPPVTTTSSTPQATPPPPLLASVAAPSPSVVGGTTGASPSTLPTTAPSLTPVTTGPTPVIISSATLSKVKAAAAAAASANSAGGGPTRPSIISVSTTHSVSMPPKASVVTSLPTSHPPPPILIPSSVLPSSTSTITVTMPTGTTTTIPVLGSPPSIVTSTPPAIVTISNSPSVSSPQPPVLFQQPRPTLTSPATPASSQATPERPVLTPVVAATVSATALKGVDTPKGVLQTTPFAARKQELFPHLIQQAPATTTSAAAVTSSSSISTINIVGAKPVVSSLDTEKDKDKMTTSSGTPTTSFPTIAVTIPSLSNLPPQQLQQQQAPPPPSIQPPKVAATIPPPPPVVIKPPLKPVFGPGPTSVISTAASPADSPKQKKKKAKASSGQTPPVKQLAPLPAVGAPPPPPVIVSTPVTLSTTTSSLTATPTPGRKTPVKKRIPPPMDSPGKPMKAMEKPTTVQKPGKMNPEAMNAAIASVGATPPPPMSVPTTVITSTSASLFQGSQPPTHSVIFATGVGQPPPQPVTITKPSQPVTIKSSVESIAASIAAVASGSTSSLPKTAPPSTTTTGAKSVPPMKRFMKETSDKFGPGNKDNKQVFSISSVTSTSTPMSSSQGPLMISKPLGTSEPSPQQHHPQHTPPPPPITIQAKFQTGPGHSLGPQPSNMPQGPAVTFMKAPPGSIPPGSGGSGPHHILDAHHHPHPHPHQSNLPKHPVIIIPAAPVVIKPAPFQHGQVIMSKPVHIEGPRSHAAPSSSQQPQITSSGPQDHHQQQQRHQTPPPPVLVSASPNSQGIVKSTMLPITVTPSPVQVSSVPTVSVSFSTGTMQALSNTPAAPSGPAISISQSTLAPPPPTTTTSSTELKPVSAAVGSVQELPPSITVTKATSVMKSISPDIIAVSSYNSSSSNKNLNSSSMGFTPLKQESRVSSEQHKEPEIVVKPAPASAQIVFHTAADTKKVEVIRQSTTPSSSSTSLSVNLSTTSKMEAKDSQAEENSLLCEEIIPGSPTTGEDLEDKMEEEEEEEKKDNLADQKKLKKDVEETQEEKKLLEPPTSELRASSPAERIPPSAAGNNANASPNQKPVIVLGPKAGEVVAAEEHHHDDSDVPSFMLEDHRRTLKFGEDDDDENNKLEERSVDSPMGPPSEGREADLHFRDSFSEAGDHSPPSSPSTRSTISTDDSSRQHDTSRLSPTPEGGSSKSKDSDEDDMDSDVGSKSTHLDDADSKHGSTRGSTRIRNQTSRLGRSPSPPMSKRRRLMRRNKSPEEVSRYQRTIRTSSGRKVTPTGRGADMMRERERELELKQPPPPPINLAKPPKTGRYNFIPNLNGITDPDQRIAMITQSINDLKEQYQKTKNEAASFERRVKRWKRRVREKERLARQEATRATS